jgi:hypothetical protein
MLRLRISPKLTKNHFTLELGAQLRRNQLLSQTGFYTNNKNCEIENESEKV